MLASELIHLLQQTIDQHGDLTVQVREEDHPVLGPAFFEANRVMAWTLRDMGSTEPMCLYVLTEDDDTFKNAAKDQLQWFQLQEPQKAAS